MGSSGSSCLWMRVLVGLVLVLNCGFCFRCVSTAVYLEDVDVDLHLARRGLLAWGLSAPMPRQQMNAVAEAAGPRYAARYRRDTGGDLNDSFGFEPLPLTIRAARRSSVVTSLKVEVPDEQAETSLATPGPFSEHRQGE